MADTKISALTALTGANTASGDLLDILDVSDTTMAASGTNKSITRDELRSALALTRAVFVTGSYFVPQGIGQSLSNGMSTYSREVAVPFVLDRSRAFDRIGVYCDTLGSSTALARLGIRNASADGVPGTLVLDAGTADCTTTGEKAITISQTLAAGAYWLTATLQGSGSGAKLRAANLNNGWLFGNAVTALIQITASSDNCWSKSSVTGALNDTGSFAVSNFGGESRPLIGLRCA